MSTSVASALSFDLVYFGEVDAASRAGIEQAAARWSSRLSDPITVRLEFSYYDLGPGFLAGTVPGFGSERKHYTDVRQALVNDAKTSLDATATAHLQPAPALEFLLNMTYDSPNGMGSPTPYLDDNGSANNTTMLLTTANQKALGLYTGLPNGIDGDVYIGPGAPFDFDPSDGIDSDKYDFVGTLTHEIGHALGFYSGVDFLDRSYLAYQPEDDFLSVTTLDLFRYSQNHLGDGANYMDWTADNSDKFFSVDGGVTQEGQFANGVYLGDGYQAGHWHFKPSDKIGIMDPVGDMGELDVLTDQDMRAFDAIGYDVQSVPEPSSMALLGLGVAALIRRRKNVRPRVR